MSGLFFGNRDIDVSITASQTYKFAFLNKCLFITDEADISIQKLDGKTASSELSAYLSDNSKTAPNLEAAITKFIGQTDNSGNSILPEYVYVIGAAELDVTASTSLIEAAIEAVVDQYDFYCLVPVFESIPLNTWFATFGNTNKRIMMPYTTTQNLAVTDAEKSIRICGMYDAEDEFKNAAWAGRVVSYDELIAFKWKYLTGCTTDDLTDSEVGSLEESGWNGYREVRSLGETTGSRTFYNTADNDSFIDTIIIRDNIIYNVANALSSMFKTNEKVAMGDAGRKLVEQAISTALNYCGQKDLIEQFEDGTYQYSITVPTITATMRSTRELTGVEFTYVPAYSMEKITVDGYEILEWIED
jgi:hypothetical protein